MLACWHFLMLNVNGRIKLPSLIKVRDLIKAAHQVVENWQTGDLAGTVRQMAEVLKKIEER